MMEKDAIEMLDRIRDEDCGIWTQEAWDSFDMAMSALHRQWIFRKALRWFTKFACVAFFFLSLIAFACVDSGSTVCVVWGFVFMAVSVLTGNAAYGKRI